jgi:hypothetical protein
MSLQPSEIDRFWQNVDQRGEQDVGVMDAHTDSMLFGWGANGTTLTATGQPHYRILVPSPYSFVGWSMIANASGSAVVHVERAAVGTAFGGALSRASVNTAAGPISFSDVTGGAPPTLSSKQAAIATRLSGWSPSTIQQFDLLHVYLFSTSGLQELMFQLFMRRMRRVGS